MQSPAEFSRDHQPTYVPATNRVLAGLLTAGVYALVLVLASHHNPAPNRASEIATRMEEIQQETRQQAFQTEPAQAQKPQASPRPPQARQEVHPNPPPSSLRQQSASRQPSLLERLFAPHASAPVPTMTGGGAPSAQSTPAPGGQSAAKAPSGRAEQQASATPSASAAASASSAPGASGQQDSTNTAKTNPPSACQDAAWVRAVTNRLRRSHSAAARQQHATGVATARLVIRRSGWLNELEIAKTSGNMALDAAAYAMLRKIQPLPRIPDRIAADRIDLEVPIAFGVAGDFKITITNCGR
jgi:protein TonB